KAQLAGDFVLKLFRARAGYPSPLFGRMTNGTSSLFKLKYAPVPHVRRLTAEQIHRGRGQVGQSEIRSVDRVGARMQLIVEDARHGIQGMARLGFHAAVLGVERLSGLLVQ